MRGRGFCEQSEASERASQCCCERRQRLPRSLRSTGAGTQRCQYEQSPLHEEGIRCAAPHSGAAWRASSPRMSQPKRFARREGTVVRGKSGIDGALRRHATLDCARQLTFVPTTGSFRSASALSEIGSRGGVGEARAREFKRSSNVNMLLKGMYHSA